jgi:sec-independent protein translocase protein TatA
MPFNLGVPELLLVLVILILLFGVGRISKIAGELGKGIRSFREGLNEVTSIDEPSEQEK